MTVQDTLTASLVARANQTPDQPAHWTRNDVTGEWEPIKWSDVLTQVHGLAAQVVALGLQPGDRVVLAMPTSVPWEYCHQAILAAGGIVVGIDSHDTDHNIRHLLELTRPNAVVLSSNALWIRLSGLLPSKPGVVIIDESSNDRDVLSLTELLSCPPNGKPLPDVRPDHCATIIFTSGSTGLPKGIAYTHGQLCQVANAILERFPTIDDHARLVCWLPLSNLFQRVINLCGMIRGAQSYFVDDPARIIERLPEIQPSLFIGVPRFYEKLHAGICTRLATGNGLSRHLAQLAWRIGCEHASRQRAGRPRGWLLARAHALADHVVLSRVRALMGPNLQFMVSGSAPMPTWLLERFHGLGWLVLEAYGASENALPIALNTLEAHRFGSVGKPFRQQELKLAEDGEVLVRGPAVFTGYFGSNDTESPLDTDGFLHTGDLGKLDDEGFLWLTGRKSEIFKTSTGRRIAPAPVEALLKQIPHVEHAVLFGQDRPFVTALLALDGSGLPETDLDDDRLTAEALGRIGEKASSLSAQLSEHQRPAAVLVTRQMFSIEGGELTANLKLRRNAIAERYHEHVDALYTTLATAKAGEASSTACKVIEVP